MNSRHSQEVASRFKIAMETTFTLQKTLKKHSYQIPVRGREKEKVITASCRPIANAFALTAAHALLAFCRSALPVNIFIAAVGAKKPLVPPKDPALLHSYSPTEHQLHRPPPLTSHQISHEREGKAAGVQAPAVIKRKETISASL